MSNLDHRSFRNISSSKYSSNGRTTKETTRYCTIISSFFVDVAHEMIICDNNDVSGEET